MNKITCLLCHTTIISEYRHDFKTCACPDSSQVFIDGGNDYHRYGWNPQSHFINPEGVECYGESFRNRETHHGNN